MVSASTLPVGIVDDVTGVLERPFSVFSVLFVDVVNSHEVTINNRQMEVTNRFIRWICFIPHPILYIVSGFFKTGHTPCRISDSFVSQPEIVRHLWPLVSFLNNTRYM
jgi:hypothetical protein